MARSPDWTEAKLKRFLAEGRGQGERENYRPWLTVMDIPSRGRASRVFSRKCNRVVHLLTDTQLRYFYLLEWDESILDIKEQFPLLDVETILEQMDESLLKRLKDPKTEVPHVITTTFVITAKDHKAGKSSMPVPLKMPPNWRKRRHWRDWKFSGGIGKPARWILPL